MEVVSGKNHSSGLRHRITGIQNGRARFPRFFFSVFLEQRFQDFPMGPTSICCKALPRHYSRKCKLPATRKTPAARSTRTSEREFECRISPCPLTMEGRFRPFFLAEPCMARRRPTGRTFLSRVTNTRMRATNQRPNRLKRPKPANLCPAAPTHRQSPLVILAPDVPGIGLACAALQQSAPFLEIAPVRRLVRRSDRAGLERPASAALISSCFAPRASGGGSACGRITSSEKRGLLGTSKPTTPAPPGEEEATAALICRVPCSIS